MIGPLVSIIENPNTYYYVAYAANAKLALGSVQMDKIVLDDTYADISTTLNESISCLRIVSSTLETTSSQNEHDEQALFNLCKSIDGFRSSAKRLYDLISDKKSKYGNRTPPPDMERWNAIIAYLNSVLQQCGETLPITINLALKKKSTSKRAMTAADMMVAFIDIMVLLARMQFDISDETSYQQSYEYLSTAEQLCAEKKFLKGYRYLSGSYYNIGTALIKKDERFFGHAIYPLRKACSLLEKDPERAQSDEGRLQLCKRYEILGICCHKNKQFEDSVKAYRLALKRVPVSTVDSFVSGSETKAVSRMMECEPLIPKLMDRYLRAAVSDPDLINVHFASEYVQMAGLSAIQQSFVYECELKVWHRLSLKMDVSRFQLFIVNKLLQLYDAVNYPVRRAR
ncbi:uncharacterized protein BX663DRAFT_528514 [Cokeromyces recurvatus]|uniref:uncharacterized protein n=1 Tax=Cokeromyces recurvatus TaxID=90255 RepID=UPI00221F11BB|nr:uncharacterized protein BX663DRAFT_528514 [Cokeromyces recurvatus]KAI7907853.1 hypothetical protein BX663DRAFT_528514 [Cokeromyces recurvatus]